MCLLESIKHHTTGVKKNTYSTEIEGVFNNDILSVETHWKLPVNGDTLSPVSLCNTGSWIFGGKIGMLFWIIFCRHSDNNIEEK